jgi:phosphoribosylanthranilate isomerase
MGTAVKICGLTRPADAERAAMLGAAALGVVFAESPRRVSSEQALAVFGAAPPAIVRIGVFADQEPAFIREVAQRCRLDWVQLSGREPASVARQLPVRVLKAVHVRSAADLEAARGYPAAAFLLDAPPVGGQMGGTGRTFAWDQAASLPWPRHRVIVAGGLTPANVGELIARLRPGGVDVSSGVEAAPGVKDHARLAAFFAAVERADGSLTPTPCLTSAEEQNSTGFRPRFPSSLVGEGWRAAPG